MNPQESQILGLKTYPRVGDIPEPVDFAIITVPAQAVPEVVEECLTKRIYIIGPNCFGVCRLRGGLTVLPGQDFPNPEGT